jgi:hypothetical protein
MKKLHELRTNSTKGSEFQSFSDSDLAPLIINAMIMRVWFVLINGIKNKCEISVQIINLKKLKP